MVLTWGSSLEGFIKIQTIDYGNGASSSDVYTKDSTIVIIDYGITEPAEAIFDYDLYTQSQNRLMNTCGKLFRFLDSEDIFISEREYGYEGVWRINSNNIRVDTTPIEMDFEKRFLDIYGQDSIEYLYKEYPVLGINGYTLFLNYAVNKKDGSIIAVEENGVKYHHPQLIREKEYLHQLEKQVRTIEWE